MDASEAWAKGFREGYETAKDGPNLTWTTSAGTGENVFAFYDQSVARELADALAELPQPPDDCYDCGAPVNDCKCDASPSLTPEEMDRMRLYHATKLQITPDYLASLHVGEDRWTRKDLEGVDAWFDAEARKRAWRQKVVAVVLGLATGAALGNLAAWLF